MFERFTDRARATVVHAQEEARALDHSYIGTEHLLLGLLRVEEGLAAIVLGGLGITIEDVRNDVESIIGRGGEPSADHVPFTPRSKKVLELSLREALQLGHNYIGTEHILLALVREGEGVAAQVLARRGVRFDSLRAELLARLRGSRAQGSPTRVAAKNTPAAAEVLSAAEEIAGSAALGSHHLLEALVRSEGSYAAKVLAALGVDATAVVAKIDELGPDGTTDLTPAVAAARRMELSLTDDGVHIVLRDEEVREVVGALTNVLGNPVRGDDPLATTFVSLRAGVLATLAQWCVIVDPDAQQQAAPARVSRSAIAKAAIQERLRRRRQP